MYVTNKVASLQEVACVTLISTCQLTRCFEEQKLVSSNMWIKVTKNPVNVKLNIGKTCKISALNFKLSKHFCLPCCRCFNCRNDANYDCQWHIFASCRTCYSVTYRINFLQSSLLNTLKHSHSLKCTSTPFELVRLLLRIWSRWKRNLLHSDLPCPSGPLCCKESNPSYKQFYLFRWYLFLHVNKLTH